jgi:hypothetical protein
MHNVGPGAWRTAVGAYDHHRFLRERLESYRAVQHVNELVPPTGKVVWFGEAAHLYAERVYQDDVIELDRLLPQPRSAR